MKVVFDVKNVKSTEPIKNDSVLLYDATNKNWYVTSKELLLHDFYQKSNDAIKLYSDKYAELEKKFIEFQQKFAEQYKQIVELNKLLVSEQGRK